MVISKTAFLMQSVTVEDRQGVGNSTVKPHKHELKLPIKQ